MTRWLDAVCSEIREWEPKRPSTRLRTIVAQELMTAAPRGDAPPKHTREVSGDLAWIVTKAFEKTVLGETRRRTDCQWTLSAIWPARRFSPPAQLLVTIPQTGHSSSHPVRCPLGARSDACKRLAGGDSREYLSSYSLFQCCKALVRVPARQLGSSGAVGCRTSRKAISDTLRARHSPFLRWPSIDWKSLTLRVPLWLTEKRSGKRCPKLKLRSGRVLARLDHCPRLTR